MDATTIGAMVAASVISSGLTGLISATLTTRNVTAVMDQKVSDVTRRVGILEDEKVDAAVANVLHDSIIGKIVDVAGGLTIRINGAYDEIARERHRLNNIEQRAKA